MNDQSYRFKNKRQRRIEKQAKPGPTDDVLLTDVQSLLKSLSLANDISNHGSEPTKLPELQSEVELTVSEISSTGDALAYHDASGHVYVVPFAVPGDVVIAKVFKHVKDYSYSLADFVKLVEPSSRRDDSLIRCPYFSKCSGCQFQMLPYSDQLAHKKTIVEKAYRNFSGLDPHLVPSVGDTIGSPLEYGYRTKLTPHFDGPPGGRRDRRNNVKPKWSEVPPIGFMKKGTRSTLDIEDCPIGTDAVRAGMKRERQRVAENIDSYLRGATLLLRENTERKPKPSGDQPADALPGDAVVEDRGEYLHVKTCMTDSNATTTEYIDDHVFQNPAGAFFQNNNSILPVFTQYIRDHILPKTPASRPITNLIDAYSGSGLFTITLSSMFKRSLGIDISASSIASATKNARLNNLPPEHASFIAADASDLFASITFPADETVVVIDPPRKGCDEGFLTQLLQYSPARVVYVSCNVHTQARDIGALVGGMEGVDGGMGMGKGVFEIESLTGFDFFPQTGHVEGVAVLRKKSEITES
ncbi:tRNAmethyltransferas-like protein [Trichodelitschia bisporula]|uniref:tRNA (uracil(54)-C(5))-methyltransferase n=1 Tax=Trichodelitschia bisporula TaxID=703511 RepID=A0A6G1HZT4_9PEZI|nr:tRNAmethyltransferas-like protein [Trichodelitschia bisporula]